MEGHVGAVRGLRLKAAADGCCEHRASRGGCTSSPSSGRLTSAIAAAPSLVGHLVGLRPQRHADRGAVHREAGIDLEPGNLSPDLARSGVFDDLFLGNRVGADGNSVTRSPVLFADRVRTPVVTIAGEQDRCTLASQAIEFHHALLEHAVDSTLVIYPGEGHDMDAPNSLADMLRRVLAFLTEHRPSNENERH